MSFSASRLSASCWKVVLFFKYPVQALDVGFPPGNNDYYDNVLNLLYDADPDRQEERFRIIR